MFASLRSEVRAKHLVNLAPTNSSTQNLRWQNPRNCVIGGFRFVEIQDLTDNIALSQKEFMIYPQFFHSDRSPTTRM